MSIDFSKERFDMVEQQLVPRGVCSAAVLDAMRNVPRHMFVPENIQSSAYQDSPLPIGAGQTISQPYIVAYMTEMLEPSCGFNGMKVLEIGTGSGYQAAVLAYLGCEVFTVEFVREHAESASLKFSACGYENIISQCSDGFFGWAEEAPFDAVIVTAAPDNVPATLIEQLKDGGKMVIPVGDIYSVQSLKLLTKTGKGYTSKDLIPVRFVPMVGGE